MRVLVTRPPAQARDWCERLAARGIDARALPLIAIEPPLDAEPVRAAWRTLGNRALAVFVSPNAVAQFFALRPAGCAWPPGLRAGAPGPGTSAALREAGLPASVLCEPPADAARFDSESLWPVLQAARASWAGARVLVVRGSVAGEGAAEGSGREWLAQQLRAAGAAIDFVVAYRRTAPRFDAAAQALWQDALARPAAHAWLLSSSEAVDRLATLAPAAAWAPACALATHARIAERARETGFGTVIETAPTLDAVVAALRATRAGR